jgi:hypothetical protein
MYRIDCMVNTRQSPLVRNYLVLLSNARLPWFSSKSYDDEERKCGRISGEKTVCIICVCKYRSRVFVFSSKCLRTSVRVFQYFNMTQDMSIYFSYGDEFAFARLFDNDWAACKDSRRVTSRWIVQMGNAPLSLSSKRQHIIAQSEQSVLWGYGTLQLFSHSLLHMLFLKGCRLLVNHQNQSAVNCTMKLLINELTFGMNSMCYSVALYMLQHNHLRSGQHSQLR